jgi:hypothetical protein
MKYLRPVYFVFAFFLICLVTFDPEQLRGAPRPDYEVRIKFGLLVVACIVLSYYSVWTFLRDRRTLGGGTKLTKEFLLKLDSEKAATLGPIAGEGPCQIRLALKKMPVAPGRDEIEICIVDAAGIETEKERFGFAFPKENYEVNMIATGPWILSIKIKFVQKPSEPFTAKVKLQVLGRARNVTVPGSFAVP